MINFQFRKPNIYIFCILFSYIYTPHSSTNHSILIIPLLVGSNPSHHTHQVINNNNNNKISSIQWWNQRFAGGWGLIYKWPTHACTESLKVKTNANNKKPFRWILNFFFNIRQIYIKKKLTSLILCFFVRGFFTYKIILWFFPKSKFHYGLHKN